MMNSFKRPSRVSQQPVNVGGFGMVVLVKFCLSIDAGPSRFQPTRAPRLVGVLTLVLVLLGLGCSPDSGTTQTAPEIFLTPRQTAEEIIRTKIAAQAGLGGLVATCDNVASVEIGSSFECQAVAQDGRVVDLTASVEADGYLNVLSTNLITAKAIPSFEVAAVDALNQNKQVLIPYENIDCGDKPRVLTQQSTTACAIVDPPSSLTYAITFKVRDVEARRFCLAVGKEPIGSGADPVPQAMADSDCPI